uniref:Uncharacterized protein n=1 Tax=Panagrolaimus sp. JU765 TaxID=591449 RepID=A0AC34REV7_9BILA
MAHTQRTTRMLVVVMILCVAVEFPHGLLNLCTAIYGEKFGIIVYDHLGSFMEMLTLFYSSAKSVKTKKCTINGTRKVNTTQKNYSITLVFAVKNQLKKVDLKKMQITGLLAKRNER